MDGLLLYSIVLFTRLAMFMSMILSCLFLSQSALVIGNSVHAILSANTVDKIAQSHLDYSTGTVQSDMTSPHFRASLF